MKVAVLGFGTVGVGVYEMLQSASGLEAGPVLVRPGKTDAPFKTADAESIFADESIGAVAEAMGGVETAGDYAAKALAAGKHYITANKALVVARGIELAKIARQNDAAFLFSAACGGGVPFLHNLALAAQSDEILSLSGILNGSTNFMLDAMQRRGVSYEDIMAEAKALGYLEADPSDDLMGLDALRKILLACAVAYGQLPGEDSEHEGIVNFTAEDAADIASRGYVCRLMTRGGKRGDKVFAYVEPALLPREHPGSAVLTNYNMACYEGRNAGPITLIGQGAGRYPTASALLRDLSDALAGRREMMSAATVSAAADNSLSIHSYYIRSESTSGTVVREITAPKSVREMHAEVAARRASGEKIFFAGVEETC